MSTVISKPSAPNWCSAQTATKENTMTTLSIKKLPPPGDYLNGKIDSYQWDKYVSTKISMVLSWVDAEYNETITALTNIFRNPTVILHRMGNLQRLIEELWAIDRYLAEVLHQTRVAAQRKVEPPKPPFRFYYVERLRRYISGELIGKIDNLLGDLQKEYQSYKKRTPTLQPHP